MLQAFDRCKKSLSIKYNQTAASNHGKCGRLRIQFQRLGANFADCWPRWTGARLKEVHLHSKPFGGTLKWPLKGGSCLIDVTTTAGLTVYFSKDPEGVQHFSGGGSNFFQGGGVQMLISIETHLTCDFSRGGGVGSGTPYPPSESAHGAYNYSP